MNEVMIKYYQITIIINLLLLYENHLSEFNHVYGNPLIYIIDLLEYLSIRLMVYVEFLLRKIWDPLCQYYHQNRYQQF